MRSRFDKYLGYESHRVKFDEDFWKRRDWKQGPSMEIGHHRHMVSSLEAEDVLAKTRQKSEYLV